MLLVLLLWICAVQDKFIIHFYTREYHSFDLFISPYKVTPGRVIWLDISLSGFIFTGLNLQAAAAV